MDSRGYVARVEQFPALATGLAKAQIDAILSAGPAATRAARDRTQHIPIIAIAGHSGVGRATSIWDRLWQRSAVSISMFVSACAPSSPDGTRWQGAARVGSRRMRSIGTAVCCA